MVLSSRHHKHAHSRHESYYHVTEYYRYELRVRAVRTVSRGHLHADDDVPRGVGLVHHDERLAVPALHDVDVAAGRPMIERPESPPPPYTMVDPATASTGNLQHSARGSRAQHDGRDQSSSSGNRTLQHHSRPTVQSRSSSYAGNRSLREQDEAPSRSALTELDSIEDLRNLNATMRTSSREAAVFNQVTATLDDELSSLDGLQFNNKAEIDSLSRGVQSLNVQRHRRRRADSSGSNSSAQDSVVSWGDDRRPGLINFKKTWYYANSRLPPYLPPVPIYTETWPILCRAAAAAYSVYNSQSRSNHDGRVESSFQKGSTHFDSSSDEREHYIVADRRTGTKAMAMKTTAVDDRKLIIIAVQGSKWNLTDWAINFRQSPTAPTGFLSDGGNACHAGFLSVARASAPVVAARLRDLLEQDRSRRGNWSVVFTGHSAGGAVAALLYAHMLSGFPHSGSSGAVDAGGLGSTYSELASLAPFFRRIHCVTFGAPPISLLPMLPPLKDRREAPTSIFIAFINEGDPVVRADRQYLSTLARVVTAPVPEVYASRSESRQPQRRLAAPRGHGQNVGGTASSSAASSTTSLQSPPPHPPYCPVPEATLSNAGRLVLLRERVGAVDQMEAAGIDDAMLRGVVFGDPRMHSMALYKARIDRLAVEAVTGRHG